MHGSHVLALTRQSRHYLDSRAIVVHCKKNKNLDALQNDPSEIQNVVNLNTHKTLTDNLNLKDTANIFREKRERRRLIFGRF